MDMMDAEFALRFCVWSTTAAAAIIFMHWAWMLRRGHMRDGDAWIIIPLVGEAIKHIGWTVHQYWWNQSWILFNTDKADWQAFQSSKWIVYASEVVILISMIGILSPYLIVRCGKWWPVAGAAVISLLYVIGYVVGFPR